MSQRRDLLGECNTESEALPIFQEAWCRRCINPECTRSMFGASKFDIRVRTWEDRLFRNPPKMAPTDPRFQGIAGKKFLTLNQGSVPDIWTDPHHPPVPPPTTAAPRPPEPPRPPPTTAAPRQPVPPRPTPPVPQSSPSATRPETFQINPPNQSGKVLQGGRPNQTPTKPHADAWDAPKPAENVIPVGGKVRFRKGQ